MDYDKLINDRGVYLYKDDSFNTISICLSWLASNSDRDNAIYDLMTDYIMNSNKLYTSRDEINNVSKYLYGIDIYVDLTSMGKQKEFEFNIDMVSPTVVGDNYANDAFMFAKALLECPAFNDQELFETYKRVRLSNIKSGLCSSVKKARDLYFENVIPVDGERYLHTTDYKKIEELFNSITLKDLRRLYKKTINDKNFHNGLVFGNITDEEFKLFREWFPYESNMGKLDYRRNRPINEGTIIIPTDSTDQSIVYQTFSLDRGDRGTIDLLADIFMGSSNLCLEILREKYRLVYESFCQIYYFDNFMYIKSKIDKKDLDKLIEATDEMLSIVQDEKSLKPYLDRAKEATKIDGNLLSEDRDSLIRELTNRINDTYDGYDYNKFTEDVDKVKEEDVTKLTKTIKRKNVFMYRGDAK